MLLELIEVLELLFFSMC